MPHVTPATIKPAGRNMSPAPTALNSIKQNISRLVIVCLFSMNRMKFFKANPVALKMFTSVPYLKSTV